MKRWLLLTGGALALGACSLFSISGDNSDGPPYRVTAKEDVRWTPEDWPETLKADIYQPRTNSQRPAMLMVHGGGWERRSRSDMNSIANQFAEAGYVVMNIDHRFAPKYKFPAQLHDAQVAMTWLRDNAESLNVDKNRIAVYGFSSGAHIVSMLALVSGQETALDEPWGGEALRPAAVIAGGVPADLTLFDSGRRLVQLLGGTESELPEEYRQASPVTHVHRDAPPFFLYHGTRDSLVPIEQAKVLKTALEDVGVAVELHEQPLRNHLLSFVFNGAANDGALMFLEERLKP